MENERAGSMLIPSLRYRDAPAAIAWLERVFGFTRHAVYEGPNNTIAHAELCFGNGMLMLGSASNTNPTPERNAHPDEIAGRNTAGLYLIAENTEELHARAVAAGATITMPLRTMEYGGLAFACVDPEGYQWSFGQYDPWKTI